MMLLGSITIPVSSWIWAAAGLSVVTLTFMIWSYSRAPWVSIAHRIAFVLKLTGICILALCLIEPLWSGRRAKTGANLFVVVADNSGGMNIRDAGTDQSRGQILRNFLNTESSNWLATLADNFQLRQYLFDSRLQRTTDFSELDFNGKASNIYTSLRTIAERYRNRPLAGIILMTDGIATDLPDSGDQLSDLSGLPAVYPVLIGGSRPQKDLSLTNVSVNQTSFEDSPVTIRADVEASGYSGKTITVNVTDDSGNSIEQQNLKISRGSEKQTFRFRLRPDKNGILFYHLAVSEKIEDESAEQSEQPSEATLANNKSTVVVDRGEGPYRILYVTGRPNWEYKFLQRALAEDEQLEMVGLIRAARREPKYDFRGHTGESSNPLYRGFDVQDQEETEQYDEPVFVRLNTIDEKELLGGFPKTAEDLFRYYAIILDDVDAEFFTYDQMDLIRNFVAQRGGGFMMLGGKESFKQGNFDRTPIGSILPVYLDQSIQGETVTQKYLNLTREGWLQPWARLRENEQDEIQRMLEMPEFLVINRVGRGKPGASTIATFGDNEHQQFPALVVQRFGNGRSAALTVGDIWRWGLKWPELQEDMNKFWRQTLRWLVADVPERITIRAQQKIDQVNQPIVFQVKARDKAFEPMDNVAITIEVRDPEQQTVQLTAEAVPSEIGIYEAAYIPRDNGIYFAQAAVTDVDGLKIGDAQTGLSVNLDAREFRSIGTNRPLLEKIARQTGGEVVELDGLDDLVSWLPNMDAPIAETWIKPIWDLPGVLPMVFAVILICFVGEWALRRWKGLP
jgi:uncharacterized membrane protein